MTNKEEKLLDPIELDGYRIKTPDVSVKWAEGEKAQLQITIHEGRNRQIRRMCDIVGLKVTRLMRISEGGIVLGDLPSGKWRYLTDREVRILRK